MRALGRAIADEAAAQGLLSQVTPAQASAYARCRQHGGATAPSPPAPAPVATSRELAVGVSGQLRRAAGGVPAAGAGG